MRRIEDQGFVGELNGLPAARPVDRLQCCRGQCRLNREAVTQNFGRRHRSRGIPTLAGASKIGLWQGINIWEAFAHGGDWAAVLLCDLAD